MIILPRIFLRRRAMREKNCSPLARSAACRAAALHDRISLGRGFRIFHFRHRRGEDDVGSHFRLFRLMWARRAMLMNAERRAPLAARYLHIGRRIAVRAVMVPLDALSQHAMTYYSLFTACQRHADFQRQP